MKIEYSKKFIKDFKRCPNYIKSKLKSRLEIFIQDQNNVILNNLRRVKKLSKY